MEPAGNITIRLAWDGQQVQRVHLDPRRLAPIRSLLRGKSAPEAERLVSMLYGLCGEAQTAAAAIALQTAQSGTDPVAPLWRERRVLIEALQEQLWRLLLDLPRILRAPADPALLNTLRRGLAVTSAAPDETTWQFAVTDMENKVGSALLGSDAAGLGRLDADELIPALLATKTTTAHLVAACLLADQLQNPTAALMPHADRGQVMAHLEPALRAEPGFRAQPHWRGRVFETGPLARLQGHGALATLLARRGATTGLRLLARLVEIGALFSRLRSPEVPKDSWVQGASSEAGVGVAWVQTARGLLLHRVVLDKRGAIEDYSIVAPTEWNFHPNGPSTQALHRIAAASRAEALCNAELVVHSLDPCVPYRIELNHPR